MQPWGPRGRLVAGSTKSVLLGSELSAVGGVTAVQGVQYRDPRQTGADA